MIFSLKNIVLKLLKATPNIILGYSLEYNLSDSEMAPIFFNKV